MGNPIVVALIPIVGEEGQEKADGRKDSNWNNKMISFVRNNNSR